MLEGPGHIPTALRPHCRWLKLGPALVPALLVHPGWTEGAPCPVVIWLHGRTATKELDPGRYLRWMRAGIGTCALDLPGHGERKLPGWSKPQQTLEVVTQLQSEIDQVVEALGAMEVFDPDRLGIGGVSGGGMAVLARLCRPHPFRGASVEAATGCWRSLKDRPAFRDCWDEASRLDPIAHLDGWREIPLLSVNARLDEWVPFAGQAEFIAALRARYGQPDLVELVEYGRTGAPNEHAGFGLKTADAKRRQLTFFRRWLGEG